MKPNAIYNSTRWLDENPGTVQFDCQFGNIHHNQPSCGSYEELKEEVSGGPYATLIDRLTVFNEQFYEIEPQLDLNNIVRFNMRLWTCPSLEQESRTPFEFLRYLDLKYPHLNCTEPRTAIVSMLPCHPDKLDEIRDLFYEYKGQCIEPAWEGSPHKLKQLMDMMRSEYRLQDRGYTQLEQHINDECIFSHWHDWGYR